MKVKAYACVDCHTTFQHPLSRGRPPIRCPKCRHNPDPLRRKAVRSAPALTVLPTAAERVAEAAGHAEPVLALVQAELSSAGTLETSTGAIAVSLARLLDAGGHTASSAASLARELRATMAQACKDEEASDALDTMAQRWRDRRKADGA